MFDSVYSIALDILGKLGGDTTAYYDSVFSIALEILDVLGGDTTKKFDSVYSILLDIYEARFGTALSGMDSTYSILKEINKGFDPSDTTKYDSAYSVLVAIDEQPSLVGHLFEIVTDSANTVIINGEQRTSARFEEGTTVTWSVSRTGYVTQSGSYTMNDQDYSLNVTLVLDQFTFTINPTPNDATVVINGVQRTSLTADYGTAITWSVSRTGYATQTGSYTLTQDYTESVSLVINQYTFSISTDSANTVVINGSERTSLTADYGTAITWSVSRTGYVTQTGSYTLTQDYTESVTLVLEQFTLTINPTPNDATVIINGVERSTLTAPSGTYVEWSVSKTGYVTQSWMLILTQDVTENVSLVLEQHTFSISTDSANTVIINGEERTSLTAPYGTAITWSVSRTGYVTQNGSYTLTQDHTENVTLSVDTYVFTIEPTPNDATVVINGQQRTSYSGNYGDSITWSVSKTGYVTQTGTYTLNSSHTESVTLALEQHTFTISTDSANTVVINGEQRTSLTADYGTVITWSVSRTGYTTQTGSYTLTQDHTESVTLVLASYTVTVVPTPNDATVMINGVIGTTYTATYGSAITWTVGKTGYNTQTGSFNLEGDVTIPVTLSLAQYTFTINATPNDATVVINGVERSTLTTDYGTSITWSVSKTGYVTQTDTETLTANTTRNVSLVEEQYTFSITPDPLDATVIINGSERSFINVTYGTAVTWSVSKTGYVTQTGTTTVTQSSSMVVTLIAELYTFTINATPNDATVVINGSERSSISVYYGTLVDWSVSKTGYTTQSGSATVTQSTTLPVTLVAQQYTFTISPDPIDAEVVMNGQTRSSITVAYGTVVTWSVSRTGYVTQSGSTTVTQTSTQSVTLSVQQYTFSITATPAGATVMINGNETNSYTGDYFELIEWSVRASGYITQDGQEYLVDDIHHDIDLVPGYTFSIVPDPVDATVMIDGEERSSIFVEEGTEVTWEVSAENYDPDMGSYVMEDSDHTEYITLNPAEYTVTITPDPADATVVINGDETDTYTAPYGELIEWSVGKTGYETEYGSFTLTEDTDLTVTLVSSAVTLTFDKGINTVKLVVNGEYLGTGSSTHTVTVNPGDSVHWEAYRSGYATRKGDLVASTSQTIDTSLSNAHFFECGATSNPSTNFKKYDSSSRTYSDFAKRYDSTNQIVRSVSQTVPSGISIYGGTSSGDHFMDTTILNVLDGCFKFEHITPDMTNMSTPFQMSLGGGWNVTNKINAVSIDGADFASSAKATNINTLSPNPNAPKQQYTLPDVYMNNVDTSANSSLYVGTMLGPTVIKRSSNNVTQTPSDYPFRTQRVYLNCWENINTLASHSINDSIMMYYIYDGDGFSGSTTTYVYNLMKQFEVDFYAYGWSSANITTLKNQFCMYATSENTGTIYPKYSLRGSGVIRVWIDATHYWLWRMEDEYASWTDLLPSGTSNRFNACTQWTLVDTTA